MPSHYVLDALERARASGPEREARIRPFLDADLYLIFAEPKWGEFYTPESDWPALTSKRQTLACLKQNDDAAYVILRPAQGSARDVSADFARDWFAALCADGFDPERDAMPGFISRHLTHDEMNAYLTGRADEARLRRQTRSPELTGRV